MSVRPLLRDDRGSIAVLTLNRPERMNAMAFDVMVPLREALASLLFLARQFVRKRFGEESP